MKTRAGNGQRWMFGRLALLASVILSSLCHLTFGQPAGNSTIHGQVLDPERSPIAGATIRLERAGDGRTIETKSGAKGDFSFSDLSTGKYSLFAEMAGTRSSSVEVAAPQETMVILVLANREGGSSPAKPAMEFADDPHFTIAGVTDWTAAGGHGSDVSLRTSEALNRDTLSLKPSENLRPAALPNQSEARLRAAWNDAPQAFETNQALGEFYLEKGRYADAKPLLEKAFAVDPRAARNELNLTLALNNLGDFSQAKEHVDRLMVGKENADVDRVAGEVYERAGQPLVAVNDFERAARLDPSEQNYFEWGSELLYHRAVWQAKAVFEQGIASHPGSVRLLTSLGATLFAGALYDQAAQRLCEASDIDPEDPAPYEFMGKIEVVAPKPLPCVDSRLERYVERHPENALGNYFYAMALWKQGTGSLDNRKTQEISALLTKAVTIDPACGDAYLQLGNLQALEKDFGKAIDFYNKALEANPQASEAHYRLGVAYDRIGERSKAQREFALHDKIEKEKSAAVDRDRREIKQFVVEVPATRVPPAQ